MHAKMTKLEHVLPAVAEYLHLVDAASLSMVSRKLQALMGHLTNLNANFKHLSIHGLDSSDCELDLKLSDFLFKADVQDLHVVLAKFEKCEELFVFNTEEACEKALLLPLCVSRMNKLSTIVLCNVTQTSLVSAFDSTPILSLKLGFNPTSAAADVSEQTSSLSLAELKTLEITGFEPSQQNIKWLLSLLKSIKALRWLRISLETRPTQLPLHLHEEWNTDQLFYLELVLPGGGESLRTNHDKHFLESFSNNLLGTCPFLPHLHTVTLNRSPDPCLWNAFTLCKHLMHLVLTGIDPKLINLKQLSCLFKNNCKSLQILILKFSGKCSFHLDSLLQLVLNCGGNPPLERFEIEVEMDHTNALMETPSHTIKAAATLRCRYRNNMYFKRSKFGIAMAFHRLVCLDASENQAPPVASPMELFCEEMIRGMHETEERDSPQIETEMINEWNKIGQIQRNMYVEIFDEYVEKELTPEDPPCLKEDHSGDRGYCDVAATIANLRE